MAKSDISQQIQIAQFNLSAMYGELERTKTLMEVAVTADTIGTELSQSVRDAALQVVLRSLHPEVQAVEDNVVEFPRVEEKLGPSGDLGESRSES